MPPFGRGWERCQLSPFTTARAEKERTPTNPIRWTDVDRAGTGGVVIKMAQLKSRSRRRRRRPDGMET